MCLTTMSIENTDSFVMKCVNQKKITEIAWSILVLAFYRRLDAHRMSCRKHTTMIDSVHNPKHFDYKK